MCFFVERLYKHGFILSSEEAGYTNRKFTNPFDVDNGGKRFDDESDSDNEAGGDKAEDDEQYVSVPPI